MKNRLVYQKAKMKQGLKNQTKTIVVCFEIFRKISFKIGISNTMMDTVITVFCLISVLKPNFCPLLTFFPIQYKIIQFAIKSRFKNLSINLAKLYCLN